LGGLEVLVDDEVAFAGTFWGYWVDGEDDLLVAKGPYCELHAERAFQYRPDTESWVRLKR